MAKEIAEDTFEQDVLKASTPVLVDFSATWCGPCLQQTPILEKWAEANQGKVQVVEVDVDKAPTLASQHGVMSIPTLVLFSNGQEAGRAIGLQNETSLNDLLAKARG